MAAFAGEQRGIAWPQPSPAGGGEAAFRAARHDPDQDRVGASAAHTREPGRGAGVYANQGLVHLDEAV